MFLPGRIPGTGEPGGLQSMGSQRVSCDSVTQYSTAHGLNICHCLITKMSFKTEMNRGGVRFTEQVGNCKRKKVANIQG